LAVETKNMTTTLKQVNLALQTELPGIKLVKGKGYYWVWSDDDKLQDQLAGLYSTTIGVYHVSQQTVEQWIDDVKRVLTDWERSLYDRKPVIVRG